MAKRKKHHDKYEPSAHIETSLIHPNSCPAAKSEFGLSSVPPTQASVLGSDVMEYRPLAAVSGDTPLIEFIIPAMPDRYTDLDDMFLYIKFKYEVTGATASDSVCPVNNLLHSMFAKCDMTLQDRSVTSSSQHYAYKSYVEKLLGYGSEAKKTYSRTAGWMRDTAFDVPDATRKAAMPEKTTIELIDRLHLDLCSQDRVLLNGVQVKLSLQTNRPSFYFHASKKEISISKVTFEHVALFVKHVEVSEMQANAHRAALLKGPLLWPISRNEIRQFVLSKGEQNRSLDNVVQGQLPRRMFVMLVKNAAENGDITLNPFNFQHFKLNFLACYLNGDQYPAIPYQPDYEKGLCVREYFDLYRSLNQLTAKPNLDITLAEFKSGFTIYGINFAADSSDPVDGHFNPLRRGNLRIDLRFAEALTDVITVLVFTQFESLVSIDKDRNIYTDYK